MLVATATIERPAGFRFFTAPMIRTSCLDADASIELPRPAADRGFALVTVVALTALLAFILAGVAADMRARMRTATDAARIVRAEAAADGAVALAIAQLSEAGDQPRSLAGLTMTCRALEGAVLNYTIADVSGLVDLNFATPALLDALLLGIGFDEVRVRAVRDAILDYRDSDDSRRPDGAESAEYAAAGRAGGPANAPFIAADELASVLGVDAELFAALAPHITVDSGQSGLDPKYVSATLSDIISRGLARGAGGPSLQFGGSGSTGLPRELTIASTSRAIGVRGLAREPNGSIFVREAVVVVSTDARRQEIDSSGTLRPLVQFQDRGAVRTRLRTTRWRQGMISSLELAILSIDPTTLPDC